MVIQVETCPRCGTQKPFWCPCSRIIDAEGGLSIMVSEMTVVQAVPLESSKPSPAEHFIVLKGQHGFTETKYRLNLTNARQLALLITKEIDNLESN